MVYMITLFVSHDLLTMVYIRSRFGQNDCIQILLCLPIVYIWSLLCQINCRLRSLLCLYSLLLVAYFPPPPSEGLMLNKPSVLTSISSPQSVLKFGSLLKASPSDFARLVYTS